MDSRAQRLPFVFVATLLVATAGLLFSAAVSLALANDTAVGGVGGVVYPLENVDIRMEAETVQVVCYRSFAEYLIDFKFVNDGGSQTVDLGFPFVVTTADPMGTPPIAFSVWQDGEPLAVRVGRGVSQQDLIGGSASLGYYLHEATFPPGETMITVSYLAVPTVSSGSRLNDLAPEEFIAANITGWDAHYDYWLHTGSGWRETIQRTVVRFGLADSFKGWAVDVKSDPGGRYLGRLTGPEPYVKLDDRTYQWVFEDFEPTEDHDILLAFTRPNLWPSGGHPDVPASFGAFPFVDSTSARMDSDTESGRVAGWEAIDGRPDTASKFEAPGTGGWIELGIRGNTDVQEIRVVSGRNDTMTSFYEYGRPKSLEVSFPEGPSTVIELEDEPYVQAFPIATRSQSVHIRVVDIYPGTKSDDTYISEIELGNEPAPGFLAFSELIADPLKPPPKPAAGTVGARVQPASGRRTTTQPASSTTAPPATVVEAVSSTLGASPTAAGAVTTVPAGQAPGRLLWPAYAGLGLVVAGLALAGFLTIKLRKIGSAK